MILGIAIAFGLTPCGVLAGKTHEEITGAPYDNTKAPHESPHKAEPPTGGHENLAEAATNPIGNLIQVQIQDQYNWSNHNSDGYSNAAILQPVMGLLSRLERPQQPGAYRNDETTDHCRGRRRDVQRLERPGR